MTVYVFDSSAIIDAGERYYPKDSFPTFWEKMDGLVQSGRFMAPDILIDELGKKDDKWREWVYSRRAQIIEPTTSEIFDVVKEIMGRYPTFVNVDKNRSGGDPFFIALALMRGCTVVTGEKYKPSKPKIPDVCDGFGVSHINILQLIRSEGWKF